MESLRDIFGDLMNVFRCSKHEKERDTQQSKQFDKRLEGNRQHQTAMLFCIGNLSGPENHG